MSSIVVVFLLEVQIKLVYFLFCQLLFVQFVLSGSFFLAKSAVVLIFGEPWPPCFTHAVMTLAQCFASVLI